MKHKFKSLSTRAHAFTIDRNLLIAVLLALVQLQVVRCDLYIFAKDKDLLEQTKQRQKDEINYRPIFDSNGGPDSQDDKLYLFPNSKNCMDNIDFDLYFKSNDKSAFCSKYCMDEFAYRTTTPRPFDGEYTTHAYSTDEEGSKNEQLSSSGILHYYRNFIHVFLEKLKHEDIHGDPMNFKVNIELSRLQISKLQRFSESVNETEASGLIQEATYILKSMVQNVDHFRPETLVENVQKLFSFNLAQHTFLILGIVASLMVIVMHHFGYRRFTWKNLIAVLIFVSFVSSVVNNHIILNQKKQILRQQKLKEIIPDECFLNTANSDDKKQESKGGFRSVVYQVFKKYMGHSPTSKSCLEYQEALFINSYQSNIAETIMYTFFESIRPVAISFGDFINQFHVALVKDLSFYQAIPLLILVTIILVPVILYLMSFLFLVLFNYEFNFFHLISFKKSKNDKQSEKQISEIKAALMNQKKEMAKAIRMIREENVKIIHKYGAITADAAGVESLPSLTYPGEPREKARSPMKPPSGAQVYTEIPKLNTSEYDDDADDEDGEMNLSSNISAMLDRTLETLFENINNKENEFTEQLNMLLEENKKLKDELQTTHHKSGSIRKSQSSNLPFPLPPQNFKVHAHGVDSANGAGRASSQSPHSAHKFPSSGGDHRKPSKPLQPNQSPQTPSKIIAIGPSKTVRPLISDASPVDKYQDPAARRVRKTESILTDSIESSTERIFRNGSSDPNDSMDEKIRPNRGSNQASPSNRNSGYRNSINPNDDDADDDDDDDEDIYVILEDK